MRNNWMQWSTPAFPYSRTRAAVPATLSFQSVFSVEKSRPIQVEAALPEAQIVVLESETGSGKTEATMLSNTGRSSVGD
jgi:hypothetical protein